MRNRTKRDAWAGSFEELLTLDSPRTDCPLHFPESPPVAAPWTCPGCHNPPSELRRLAESTEPEGQHCSATRRVCEGSAAVTDRQKRTVRQLSALLVNHHDIAGIWVAFFSRCCSQDVVDRRTAPSTSATSPSYALPSDSISSLEILGTANVLKSSLRMSCAQEEAERWIEERSEQWMALPSPPALSEGEFLELTQAARR